MRKVIESNSDFSKRNFKLSELFEKYDSIEDEVKKYLTELMWHNLAKIKPMYKSTFDVDFSDDISEVFKAINIRHDLVHRSGKSIDGKLVKITEDGLDKLICLATDFIADIDRQLSKLKRD